jgi:hypothetical protein
MLAKLSYTGTWIKLNSMNYSGSLKITNPNTLAEWKLNGKYQELIDQGYFYNEGCGRFRKENCECNKCKRKEKITLDNIMPDDEFEVQYFMVNGFGTVYRKYWERQVYKPDYEFPKSMSLLDHEKTKHIVKHKEHLQFFIDNNRIRRINKKQTRQNK